VIGVATHFSTHARVRHARIAAAAAAGQPRRRRRPPLSAASVALLQAQATTN
jgi:hypothetical protein